MNKERNFAEPPDTITCVNCGAEIEVYFAVTRGGGWWIHSANGDERCGRPSKEGWYGV